MLRLGWVLVTFHLCLHGVVYWWIPPTHPQHEAVWGSFYKWMLLDLPWGDWASPLEWRFFRHWLNMILAQVVLVQIYKDGQPGLSGAWMKLTQRWILSLASLWVTSAATVASSGLLWRMTCSRLGSEIRIELTCWLPWRSLVPCWSASTSNGHCWTPQRSAWILVPHSPNSIFPQQSTVDPRIFCFLYHSPDELPTWPWNGDFSSSVRVTAWLTCSWRPLLLSKWLFWASSVGRLENASVFPFYFIVLIRWEMLVQ